MAYGSSPPPKMKTKRPAKKTDAEKMKEHKKHHTTKHIAMMRKLMKEGMSFSAAHRKTMKEIGK